MAPVHGPYAASATAVTACILLARWSATPAVRPWHWRWRWRAIAARLPWHRTACPPSPPEADAAPHTMPLERDHDLREIDAQLQQYWNQLRPLYPQDHDPSEPHFHWL